MATDQERAAERAASVAALETQLGTWSKKLEAVLARAVRAGRGRGYRLRTDGLWARHAALQSRLTRFEASGGTWDSFQAEIASDRESLELALEDLS